MLIGVEFQINSCYHNTLTVYSHLCASVYNIVRVFFCVSSAHAPVVIDASNLRCSSNHMSV